VCRSTYGEPVCSNRFPARSIAQTSGWAVIECAGDPQSRPVIRLTTSTAIGTSTASVRTNPAGTHREAGRFSTRNTRVCKAAKRYPTTAKLPHTRNP
jgi:hypothetical protein